MKLCKTYFILLLGFAVARPVSAQEVEFAPGELIVKLRHSPPGLQQQPSTEILRSQRSHLSSIVSKFEIDSLTPIVEGKTGAFAHNLFRLDLSEPGQLNPVLAALSQHPDIEYVQPNYIHRLHDVPNDPRFSEQQALQLLRLPEAWDILLASREVIVGVIDTGIDYEHEDLRAAIWINPGEDLNGNGVVDSTDFNNLDDDGNGFVDDIRGWDFTDAPSFPDGGDFRIPDNDPFDDNGHGTQVAGLIGAAGNNELGIAGMAYGARIMVLRAGTALGFLEEDDIASAVVYAVENGARIINMSFGDDVASPLLRDVMRFAHGQGCVLIASAGNSSTDAIHFPSGFPETISVGATNFDDQLAGFSNYGSSLDLVAPGVNVLTTTRGDRYGGFNGTSASAPLVSALAALVLSGVPSLSPEGVKGVLLASAEDLGSEGWDNFYGAGRIDALRALQSSFFSIAEITSPTLDQGFTGGVIPVSGTASGAFLQGFAIQFGAGETPDSWTEVFSLEGRQVVDDHLFDFDVSDLDDGIYTLRLLVLNQGRADIEDKVRFFLDRTPPVISGVKQTPMLDGDRTGVLLEFATDDVSDARLKFRRYGSFDPFGIQQFRFQTTSHRIFLAQLDFSGEIEYVIEAENVAGLKSMRDNGGVGFTADLTAAPIGGEPVDPVPLQLPAGFLLSKASDFDRDGFPEIILNEYDSNLNFGALKIFEFADGPPEEVFATTELFIPRDWGDSDGDGFAEILAGRASQTFVFEATESDAFPHQIKWQMDDDAWGSRFADLDQDGEGEIILRVRDVYTVWETLGQNKYTRVDSFPNPTGGSNAVGVPHSEIADFDGDGALDILHGDADGDLYIYENSTNDRSRLTWSERLPLLDATDYLTHGDYDGDGIEEFVAGCHSDPNLNLESVFDSRHWLYRVYKSDADDSYQPVWQQAFFGFLSPRDFDSGVSSGDVDNDGLPEILIHVFPDFYIVDYDSVAGEYQVIWHTTPARSNATVVGDFDGDSDNEFLFNTGESVQGYRFLSRFTGPRTPTGFAARPLDATLVELAWQHGEGAPRFRIYRGASEANLQPLGSVTTPRFLDSSVSPGVAYWYAVTAIDSSRTPVESRQTRKLRVTPTSRPFVADGAFQPPDQVLIRFSKPMGSSIANQTNYTSVSLGTASSAVVNRSGREVVLTFTRAITAGQHAVSVHDVSDHNGTPLDTIRNTTTIDVAAEPRAPHLVSATLQDANTIRLEFSEPMAPASVSNTNNYLFEPFVRVLSATTLQDRPETVLLTVDPAAPIGPFGKEYVLRVQNLRSQSGGAIRFGHGDTAALIFSSDDLTQVLAYPNPYRADSGSGFVTIAGLTREAKVRILDFSGRLVRSLQETDGNGGVAWDLRDEEGQTVPSGIYIFYVTANGQEATGKLAVLW